MGTTYSYDMWMDGAYMVTKSMFCPKSAVSCTNPSQYTNSPDCAAGGCNWCNWGGGSCIFNTGYCPSTTGSTTDCTLKTTKTGCDVSGECGWCPNSYNGGTSANGGSCMFASELASKCDN